MALTVNPETTPNLFGGQRHTPPQVSRECVESVLRSCLGNISLEALVGLLTNTVEGSMEYLQLLQGKRTCQKTSLLFNPHRLMTRISGERYGILEAITSDGTFLNGLARALLFKNGKVKETLYQCLQLGVNGTGYVNEFPPHLARDLCIRYGMSASSLVLDPCAGWGGRMLGASCVVNSYHGFEPATATADGLDDLADFIRLLRPDFAAKIECRPFEDAALEVGSYDFAITSPPYFDTELYAAEDTQSSVRYQTFEAWHVGFFRPLIHSTMAALKRGCVFILNIGSRRYPLRTLVAEESEGRYSVKDLGNLLSGASGLRSACNDGERFLELSRIT